MNLVIVESPAKGKTIEKFLGSDYKVYASYGHVRDLPKKELGVDVEKNFKVQYVPIFRTKKTVAFLKSEVKKAKNLILATDFDREGEAIAWHLSEILKSKIKRITFTEITKDAIQDAIKHPREIDMNLVHSQQSRRVLDRLVGYKLSPFLWKKVTMGLSAGRVQSVAVRLIVEREREIENFKPEEFWQIWAELEKDKQQFKATLVAKDGKSIYGERSRTIKSDTDPSRVGSPRFGKAGFTLRAEADAKKILTDLKGAKYKIEDIKEQEAKRYPPPPFITSTLQQEAFHQFSFSAKKTMYLAQQLYEKGLISYHRTDSTNLSQLAVNSARKYIKENFGNRYLPDIPRIYKTKVLKAQEAHEAIRPTHFNKDKIKDEKIERDYQKLYNLIWTRTLASQMKEAVLDTMKVEIQAKNYTFLAEGQNVKFDGFLKVYPVSIKETILPKLTINEILKLIDLIKKQDFTKPSARFTEASLIKALEKEGIGRPSTYAPIISTVQDRGYVGKSKQYLFPQEMGMIVNDLLVKHFPDIVDLKFTAKMEEELDDVAEGKKKYKDVMSGFWGPFSKNLAKKEKNVSKNDVAQEETKEVCEKCKAKMVVRVGRFGKFLACSKYPECKSTKPFIKTMGKSCPKCKKGEMIERKNKKGQIFYGCSRYPKCDFASSNINDDGKE
ncbi:MAG: type I DNA topoisomerase [Candidatus Berkelbacteria bacterium]|nr:type I DNA topoisomerase [Candidatus Berkelbacteria bacterium]